ncbi:MAG: hypothetical protein AB9888_07960 [Bacteroidales bacterium]
MSEKFDKNTKIYELDIDIDIDPLIVDENIDASSIDFINPINDGLAQVTGVRTANLQQAFNNYANTINKSVITKAGTINQSSTAQLKGFVFEVHHKESLIIDAMSKGIPKYKIKSYTGGDILPDGTRLSKTDTIIDIRVDAKDGLFSTTKSKTYQAKVYKDAKATKEALDNPQYDSTNKLGAADHVPENRIEVPIKKQTAKSDAMTKKGAEDLTETAKTQKASYQNKQERINQLNKVNLVKAVKVGAIVGAMTTTVFEVVDIIKNKKNLSEEQFVESIVKILSGTVDGGIRSGTIVLATQIFNVAANSSSAVPVMAASNVAVDFAKDLWMFANGDIDADDLLCNTVNNSFTSGVGFAGGYVGGQVGGVVAAKAALLAGASTGSVSGPIGTVVGAVVGGLVIGIGANMIVTDGKKDGEERYNKCLIDIQNNIEIDPSKRKYAFVDTMSHLKEREFTFKGLVPARNLISDMTEYNLKRKAINDIHKQIDKEVDDAQKTTLQMLEAEHKARCIDLENLFVQQKNKIATDFGSGLDKYVSESYLEFIAEYKVINGNISLLCDELIKQEEEQNIILQQIKNRIDANKVLNELISDMQNSGDLPEVIKPVIDKLLFAIKNDKLIVDKQYISLNEAKMLVGGVF